MRGLSTKAQVAALLGAGADFSKYNGDYHRNILFYLHWNLVWNDRDGALHFNSQEYKETMDLLLQDSKLSLADVDDYGENVVMSFMIDVKKDWPFSRMEKKDLRFLTADVNAAINYFRSRPEFDPAAKDKGGRTAYDWCAKHSWWNRLDDVNCEPLKGK